MVRWRCAPCFHVLPFVVCVSHLTLLLILFIRASPPRPLELLRPVMEALRRNHGRYNMMQSTILDMLAIIWKEQIKPLLIYLGDSYKETLEDITDSEVGSNLLLRCVGNAARGKYFTQVVAICQVLTCCNFATVQLRSTHGGAHSNRGYRGGRRARVRFGTNV